jgi:hypothetical protein
MGALPKNKITSSERGKRRRGNTPALRQDFNKVQIQLHKKGFVAQLFKNLGLKSDSATTKSA